MPSILPRLRFMSRRSRTVTALRFTASLTPKDHDTWLLFDHAIRPIIYFCGAHIAIAC
jgi:hypothetical protein